MRQKSLCDAYIFGFTPIGLFGAHHFYLNRIGWGFMYLFTFGLLGCGYLYDWFRLPVLVKRRNNLETCENPRYEKKKAYVDDIYILWFPFGIFGFHHYYLNRTCFGIMYTFTFGLLGLGWIIDFFRLPCLVKTYNQNLKATHALNPANGSPETGGYGQQVVFAKSDDFSLVGSTPPPSLQATNGPGVMYPPQQLHPGQQQQFPTQQQQFPAQQQQFGQPDPYAAGAYGYTGVHGMIAPPSYDATVAGNNEASALPIKSDGYGSTNPN